jgi:hypothetical protein
MTAALIAVAAAGIGAIVAYRLNLRKDSGAQMRDVEGARLCLLDTLDWAAGEVKEALESGDWTRLSEFRDLRRQWMGWLRDLSILEIEELFVIERIARYFQAPPNLQLVTRRGASGAETAQLENVHRDLRRALDILWAL